MSQEQHDLTAAGLGPRHADYPSLDLAALARGDGATGYRIAGPGDLGMLTSVPAPHDGVVVVDVAVNGQYLNPVSREIVQHLG